MDQLFKLFVVSAAVSAAVALLGNNCPALFFEAGGAWFHVHDMDGENITWEKARELCQGLSEPGWDMEMASIDSTSQLEAFAEKWATVGSHYPPYGYMWIGFTRKSGKWGNLDGYPISKYSNMWREGHPHDMNMYTYIEDVSLTSGVHSHGRFYASCTDVNALKRVLCRAFPMSNITGELP